MNTESYNSNLKERLCNYLIIDSHIHLGFYNMMSNPGKQDEDVIKTLKEFNVKKAIVSHQECFYTEKDGNDNLFKLLKKHKGFLYGLLVFNPNYKEESIKFIKDNFKKNEILGVKIHPSWHYCYPTDKKYKKFWELAEEKRIPVLTHSWNPNVPNKAQKYSDAFLFEKIINSFPNLKLILAHAGGKGDYPYKLISLLEKYSNLYVDFSGDNFDSKLIETYVKRVGPDRLLFGSDMPWIDVRFHLSNLMLADISDSEREKILGLNAQKLYGI